MNAETSSEGLSPFFLYPTIEGYNNIEVDKDLIRIKEYLYKSGATLDILEAFDRVGQKLKNEV